MSRRTEREHERAGLPDRCAACRYPGAGAAPVQVETMKGWWLARYPLAELQSWPPLL